MTRRKTLKALLVSAAMPLLCLADVAPDAAPGWPLVVKPTLSWARR
jgi:hypothetical protein